MKKITILIVEDQGYMRRTLREFLQSVYPGINILEAEDGRGALALCRERRPALVLMDIALPDTNGIELTEQIKAMLPDSHVIIVSSHTDSAYIERAQAAGALAYIFKDKVYSELLPAMSAALGRTKTEREQGQPQ